MAKRTTARSANKTAASQKQHSQRRQNAGTTVAESHPGSFLELDFPVQRFEQESDSASFTETAEASLQSVLSAHSKLEQRLILSKVTEARSAESGSDKYGFENLVGVGAGEKMTKGMSTGKSAVIVYVVKKVPTELIGRAAKVPKSVNGVPTDVVETGEFYASAHTGVMRPALGGVSIGRIGFGSGTLGCLVKSQSALYILGSNHVLAAFNQGRPGDPILQPGFSDGGQGANQLARLGGFIPILFGGPVNIVDCAIAQTSPSLVSAANLGFGKIGSAIVSGQQGLLVKKCGRSSELTIGTIRDSNATLWVNYPPYGQALFKGQILISGAGGGPFSMPGDSGSLIVTVQGNMPVALLCSTANNVTSANPIGRVLEQLGVALL